MSMLGVNDAAERLGVSLRRVQQLIARGELQAPARGLVDADSLARLIAHRAGSHTRAWSETTAWAAVALLSGADVPGLGGTQLSRLRARLRDIDAQRLVERTRGRAHVTHYVAHPSTARRLAEDVLHVDHSTLLGLVATTGIDGYVAASELQRIVRLHGLISDDNGEVTLRATTTDLDVVWDLAERSAVLVALDLAASLDAREQRAGMSTLSRALTDFHD